MSGMRLGGQGRRRQSDRRRYRDHGLLRRVCTAGYCRSRKSCGCLMPSSYYRDGRHHSVHPIFFFWSKSMSDTNKAIIENIYTAFNGRDYEGVLANFTDDFEWIAAENSPLADQSPYHGIDA